MRFPKKQCKKSTLISYPYLVKFHYFGDNSQGGDEASSNEGGKLRSNWA